MSGISGCIGCPSESPGWLGLSIMSDIEKKGNFSLLVPDGACFGPNGLIPNRSSTYLGQTKGF